MLPKTKSSGLPFKLAWQAALGRNPANTPLEPLAEFRGIEGRKYRFDYAWPAARVALEIDGGIWMARGGHTTGGGKQRDCEKDWLATQQGWVVVRWTPAMVGVENCEGLRRVVEGRINFQFGVNQKIGVLGNL